ncbi:ribonuclease H-like domain-containing protein, partial [Armillaria borealis]
RCFAHIVNLACKAVLTAITDLEFAALDAADFEPTVEEANTFGAALQRDPIALVRTLVRVIRASSLRRQFFSEVVAALDLNNLQLLRDVITRWSSTLLMIDRALYLRPAVDKFLNAREFPELRKYKLGDTEWNVLADFKEILSVPHSFQQLLSTEKTPCICNTIPAFEAMKTMWENKRLEFPHLADIITAGLGKLDDYRERADDVPVYFFAIRTYLLFGKYLYSDA